MIIKQSNAFKQAVHTLYLEQMYISRDKQKAILKVINNKQTITPELIRKIPLKDFN